MIEVPGPDVAPPQDAPDGGTNGGLHVVAVWLRPRTGVIYTSFERGFKRACELAKIPYGQDTPNRITLHGLRHALATRLQDRGVHPYTIMALMGHSSLKMTSTYRHSTPDTKETAIERLQGRGEVLEFSFRQKSANRGQEAEGRKEQVAEVG